MVAMAIQIYTENGSVFEDDIFTQDFNISHNNYETIPPPLASWEIAAIIMLLGSLIIFTVTGNIFILAAITTHKPLRIPQNYLIASLAVADLMVAVAVMPISLSATLSQRWTFGYIVCNFWISMDVLYCTASILNLCIISLDRYWAITNPVKYSRKRTTNRMMLNIATAWVVSIIISITSFLGWNTSNTPESSCEITKNVYYTIFSTFGAFYIPATIVLVVYYRISVAAKKRIRRNIPKKSPPMLFLNKPSSTHHENQPDTALSNLQHLPLNGESNSADLPVNNESNQNSFDFNSLQDMSDINSPPKTHCFYSTDRSPKNRYQKDSNRKFSKSSTKSTTSTKSDVSTERKVSQVGNGLSKKDITRHGSLRIDNRRRKRNISSSSLPDASPGSRRSIASFSFPQYNNLYFPLRKNTCPHFPQQQMGSLSSIAIEERQREKRALATAREQRATRTVFIVTGTFLVCWLPFFLAALILPLCVECNLPQVYKLIFLWLGYCNSSLNPIIYTVFNKDFKNAFKKMLYVKVYRRGIRNRSVTKRPTPMLSELRTMSNK